MIKYRKKLAISLLILSLSANKPKPVKSLGFTTLLLLPMAGLGLWYCISLLRDNLINKNSVPDDRNNCEILNNQKEISQYDKNILKAKEAFGKKFYLFEKLLTDNWGDLQKYLASFVVRNTEYYHIPGNGTPNILFHLKDLFNKVNISILKKDDSLFEIRNEDEKMRWESEICFMESNKLVIKSSEKIRRLIFNFDQNQSLPFGIAVT